MFCLPPANPCDQPFESGDIDPPSQIKASSEGYGGHIGESPLFARGSWCADSNDLEPYIQVCGIAH